MTLFSCEGPVTPGMITPILPAQSLPTIHCRLGTRGRSVAPLQVSGSIAHDLTARHLEENDIKKPFSFSKEQSHYTLTQGYFCLLLTALRTHMPLSGLLGSVPLQIALAVVTLFSASVGRRYLHLLLGSHCLPHLINDK